jgi:hypothetical protein
MYKETKPHVWIVTSPGRWRDGLLAAVESSPHAEVVYTPDDLPPATAAKCKCPVTYLVGH